MNQWTIWLIVGLIWAGLFPLALEYVLGLVRDWRRPSQPVWVLKFPGAITIKDTGPLKLPPAGGDGGFAGEKDV